MTKKALIIVDMQNAFLQATGSLGKMGLDTKRPGQCIPHIMTLAQKFREHGLKVIYLQHTNNKDFSDAGLSLQVFPPLKELGHCVKDSWDWQIIPELTPKMDDVIVEKARFSGFFKTRLDSTLRKSGIEELVVCGVATNVCVESTIRDAFYLDYPVLMPVDATASFTEEMEKASQGNLAFGFAKLVSTEDILRLL